MNYYNINYKTTYQDHIKSDPDKADIYYRNDLINIFNVDEDSDIDVIQHNVVKIYKDVFPVINKNDKFKNILLYSASKMMSNDLEMGFMLLFSFDTLWTIHNGIFEMINTGEISNSTLENIKENI